MHRVLTVSPVCSKGGICSSGEFARYDSFHRYCTLFTLLALNVAIAGCSYEVSFADDRV